MFYLLQTTVLYYHESRITTKIWIIIFSLIYSYGEELLYLNLYILIMDYLSCSDEQFAIIKYY